MNKYEFVDQITDIIKSALISHLEDEETKTKMLMNANDIINHTLHTMCGVEAGTLKPNGFMEDKHGDSNV